MREKLLTDGAVEHDPCQAANTVYGTVPHLMIQPIVGTRFIDRMVVTVTKQPVQVLVLPFRRTTRGFRFGVLRRADLNAWQGVAGGAEDLESPSDAASRELCEELSLAGPVPILQLGLPVFDPGALL